MCIQALDPKLPNVSSIYIVVTGILHLIADADDAFEAILIRARH